MAWNASLPANSTALIAAVNCDATYQTWTDSAIGANEARAMNCISWYEAMAFCIWDGGYLPTEAEWNYAATGGSEQRAYPWSKPAGSLMIDSMLANYSSSQAVRVGSKPMGDGRWEQSDLAGNVYEWNLDWYGTGTYATPCANCAQLTSGMYRMIRGGYFLAGAPSLRAGSRNPQSPADHNYYIGVRCARAR
jgi:formylglycine-generating enzyme